MNKKIFLKYRESKSHFQKMMDDEIIKLFKHNRLQHLIIVILGLRDNSGAYFFNIWQIILFRLFLFWPR